MIRLTKKFLALAALAMAFGAATTAQASVIVSYTGRVGDTFNYSVTADPEGQADIVFNVGDTITITGVSSSAVASFTVPTFPSFAPFFVGPVGSYSDLTFTAAANSFTTAGGPVVGTFSITAVAGATEGTGAWATIYGDERGNTGRNSGIGLTIPIAPTVPTNGVPEPSTIALAAVGLAGAAFARRRRTA